MLASLPDTLGNLLGFGTVGWWAEAVAGCRALWPSGFSAVFVPEEDTVVLPLQAPQARRCGGCHARGLGGGPPCLLRTRVLDH